MTTYHDVSGINTGSKMPKELRLQALFTDGSRQEVMNIKCLFDQKVPEGAQAYTLLNTLRFEEPYLEVVAGTLRPGVEDVDFIHELGHSYISWRKGIKTQLGAFIDFIFHGKANEKEARLIERQAWALKNNQLTAIRILDPETCWNHFRSTV